MTGWLEILIVALVVVVIAFAISLVMAVQCMIKNRQGDQLADKKP